MIRGKLCQRPNGSIYGIAQGKMCRKGREISANLWEEVVKAGAEDKVRRSVAAIRSRLSKGEITKEQARELFSKDLSRFIKPETPEGVRGIKEAKELKPGLDLKVQRGRDPDAAGAMGSVYLEKDRVIKDGIIGESEALALTRLGRLGISPSLLKVEKMASDVDDDFFDDLFDDVEMGGVPTFEGKIAMTRAQGRPVEGSKFWENNRWDDRVSGQFWRTKAMMHKAGVAHNDLHSGNIFYDPKSGKIQFIDMGLAKVSPKDAFAEAMLQVLGRDTHSKREKWYSPKNAPQQFQQQLTSNLKTLADEMKKDGVSPSIINQLYVGADLDQIGFGKIPEATLYKYIDIIYNNF